MCSLVAWEVRIHKHKSVPSTYHQSLKGHLEWKEGAHDCISISILIDEAYFFETCFLDELAKDREVAPARPRGVPIQERSPSRDGNQNLMKKLLHPQSSLAFDANEVQ